MYNAIKVEIVPGTPDIKPGENICASVRHGEHPFVDDLLVQSPSPFEFVRRIRRRKVSKLRIHLLFFCGSTR